MIRRLLPFFVLATASLLLAATAAARPLSRADRAFVDATVEKAIAADRLPGVALEISGPKGSYSKAYGTADRATGTPLRLDDHVRIASITKTFTATAILLQVQHGKLDLDDKLSDWIPGIPNGERITIRDLLAMRSGIYDYTSDPTFLAEFDRDPRMRFDLQDVLAIIHRHQPLFAPGARTQYADSNYYLLGAILEAISHESVATAITQEVIEPLGLRHTSFPRTASIPSPFAHGYYAGPDGDGPLRDYTEVNPDLASTAGAMISTVGDLHKYGRELATGALLDPKLQHERLVFGAIPNESGPPVGYGLGILRLGDWLGHDGAILGFSTETFYDPGNGAEIASAANLSSNFSTPTLSLFAQIARHLYPASLSPG